MSALPVSSLITPDDRIGMTLCLAILFHAIIILGITFAPEEHRSPRFDTMEIILVQQQDLQPDKDAKLLAQADLVGGGDSADAVVPSTPVPPPFPDQQARVAATAAQPPVAETPPEPQNKVAPATETPKPKKTEPVVAANAGQTEVAAPKPQPTTPAPQPKRQPSAAELLRKSFNIASLSAQVKNKLEAKAQRPRRTFISASTTAYRYAAYMEAWRAKVERIGNLNYPDEARKRKLSGSLILDVALNPDGSVNDVIIRRSSGQKILDDAAIRIVHLSAPFSPFPADIQKDTDILHITRTWQFLNNKGFR
ncbi:MAG: TonB C protein [Gammaproteobacteria bacterium]|nr:TonB C protein [Gammaproteobacteria bacterium]